MIRSAGKARPAAGELLVGGRYRLRERLGREGESSMWRAADEALRRPVLLWIFSPGLKRGDAVAAAARAACHLDDPRLARVFDVDAQGEFPYVVTEWPAGWHLGELLTVGPVDPVSAAAVVAEAAGALAVAHAGGLAHLCLRPCSLWWSPAGRVKVSGLGIAAAAAGKGNADPVLADARGLGRVLYAALTGYWPGAEQTSLPTAPRRGDRVYKPSQVRPGVPGELDAVACRALPQAGWDAGPPILDPEQLAGELAQAAGAYSLRHGLARLRLPDGAGQPAAAPDQPQPLMAARAAVNAPVKRASATVPPAIHGTVASAAKSSMVAAGQRSRLPAKRGRPAGRAGSAPRVRRRRHRMHAVIFMLMLTVAVSLGAGGWYLAHHGIGGRPGPGPGGGATPTGRLAARPVASWRAVRPADVRAFGPYGGGGGDNSTLAPLAIDGNLATAWHTDRYATPQLGNLKPGTGLLLNMGRVVTIAHVEIRLGTSPGASFQVRAGLSAARLADLPVLVRETGASGSVSIQLSSPVHARYVLIWFTRLPPGPSGTFQASVFDIRLQGRP